MYDIMGIGPIALATIRWWVGGCFDLAILLWLQLMVRV